MTYGPNIVMGVDSKAVEMTRRNVLDLLFKVGDRSRLESLDALTLRRDAAPKLTLFTNAPCVHGAVTIEGESVVGAAGNLNYVLETGDEGRGSLDLNLVALLVKAEHLVTLAVLLCEL